MDILTRHKVDWRELVQKVEQTNLSSFFVCLLAKLVVIMVCCWTTQSFPLLFCMFLFFFS